MRLFVICKLRRNGFLQVRNQAMFIPNYEMKGSNIGTILLLKLPRTEKIIYKISLRKPDVHNHKIKRPSFFPRSPIFFPPN